MICCPGRHSISFKAMAGKPAGLASGKRIAKIAFTGSTPVGSHIMKRAAEASSSTVELGGKT